MRADNAEEIAVRKPWFCSGCPHNTSTRLPEGARAYAGIGCHYMVQWMERDTEGFTHMGGEGANWVGEAPFSTRPHVFQNLGDGTYNHSGSLAIRAALAAGVNITYKILYNDAVAMTGGQPNEGGLTAPQIARELQAMGVRTIVGVYDPKEDVDLAAFPKGIRMRPREELDLIQREMQAVEGVSAILYIQTCAAEKRRRRKRGQFPDPDMRVFINPDVCEGCGDCGVQSNCVSILPLETPFGRKRTIDQSSCNKDYSCLKGFCPSFVTLEGAKVRKAERAELAIPALPEPALPPIDGTYNIVVTGVGGTGVVTIGALIAMAAHLEGLGAGEMEMAGLAQKGGAVHIHCRIAEKPSDISAIRVAVGEADAVIGGDLVVTAGAKTLGLMTRGRTRAVVNAHEIPTGDFTRDRGLRLPTDRMTLALRARIGDDAPADARRLAARRAAARRRDLLQRADARRRLAGRPRAALRGGAAPGDRDQRRQRRPATSRPSRIGRWAIVEPAAALAAAGGAAAEAPADDDLDVVIERRAAHLVKYQGERLARRYRARVEAARAIDPELAMAVAKGYHKLLSYKDEYEVARLHDETLRAAVDAQFTGVRRMRFHLAPPILGGDGPGRTAAQAELRPVDARRLRPAQALPASCAARRSTPSATVPTGGWSGR